MSTTTLLPRRPRFVDPLRVRRRFFSRPLHVAGGWSRTNDARLRASLAVPADPEGPATTRAEIVGASFAILAPHLAEAVPDSEAAKAAWEVRACGPCRASGSEKSSETGRPTGGDRRAALWSRRFVSCPVGVRSLCEGTVLRGAPGAASRSRAGDALASEKGRRRCEDLSCLPAG